MDFLFVCCIFDFKVFQPDMMIYGKVSILTGLPLLGILFIDTHYSTGAIRVLHTS